MLIVGSGGQKGAGNDEYQGKPRAFRSERQRPLDALRLAPVDSCSQPAAERHRANARRGKGRQRKTVKQHAQRILDFGVCARTGQCREVCAGVSERFATEQYPAAEYRGQGVDMTQRAPRPGKRAVETRALGH